MREPNNSSTKNSYQTVSDLGEVAYLSMRGIPHNHLMLENRQVLFAYDEDLTDALAEYWSNNGAVPAREFKVQLDSLKRLIYSFLRSKGVR